MNSSSSRTTTAKAITRLFCSVAFCFQRCLSSFVISFHKLPIMLSTSLYEGCSRKRLEGGNCYAIPSPMLTKYSSMVHRYFKSEPLCCCDSTFLASSCMSADFSFVRLAMMTHDDTDLAMMLSFCDWQLINSCSAVMSCELSCQQHSTTSPRHNVGVGCSDFWSAMFTEQVVRCDHFEACRVLPLLRL